MLHRKPSTRATYLVVVVVVFEGQGHLLPPPMNIRLRAETASRAVSLLLRLLRGALHLNLASGACPRLLSCRLEIETSRPVGSTMVHEWVVATARRDTGTNYSSCRWDRTRIKDEGENKDKETAFRLFPAPAHEPLRSKFRHDHVA